jgi:hypothetical protein
MRRRLSNQIVYAALFAVAAPALAGCAMSNPLVSSGPEPRVEDCALIQQATPSRYVCGGKTYTGVQLSDLRTAKPPESK